jgi:hypothetical protein
MTMGPAPMSRIFWMSARFGTVPSYHPSGSAGTVKAGQKR